MKMRRFRRADTLYLLKSSSVAVLTQTKQNQGDKVTLKTKQKKGLFGKIRSERKGEEVLKINIRSIKDVKRVSEEELILGYESEFSGEEGSQLAYVQVRMRAEAINDLELSLIHI